MNQSQPVLEVKSLLKTVHSPTGDLAIVHNINFAINAGESVAIIGTSGAGKSTLLGLLAGLDVASKGEVLLRGQNLFALSEDERAALRGEHMGFVFQSFQLLPTLTALENVMLPMELTGQQQHAQSRARDILQRVGLGQRMDHYPRQLSGGEQQRVAIARAFAPQPQVLLADEPTGNLDNQTGETIIDLLFELNREKQTTLVLVTHDEKLAARCQRRLRMTAGELEEVA